MNSKDFTGAFRSQAFVGYLSTVVALGLILGVLLGYLVARIGPQALQFTSSDGGYIVVFFAWLISLFVLLMARSLSIGGFVTDRFSGFLEAPLSRAVSRGGLVFTRLAGVAVAVLVVAVAGPAALIVGFYLLAHQTLPYAAAEILVAGVIVSGLVIAGLAFLFAYLTSSLSGARGATTATFAVFYWVYPLVFLVLPSRLFGGVFDFLTPIVHPALEANPLLLASTLVLGSNLIPSTYVGQWLPQWQQLLIGIAWLLGIVGGLAAKVMTSD